MYVFASENRIIELVQQLENIPDRDEVLVRMDRLGKKLWDHLRTGGIDYTGECIVEGNVGAYHVNIAGVGTDWQTGAFNFQKLNEGLAYLRPLAISVEESDLKSLVPNRLMCDAAEMAWSEIAPELQRIPPSELFGKIESIVPRVAFNRQMPNYIDESGPEAAAANREVHDYEYHRMLDRLGLEDPARKHEEIEAYRAQQEAAYKEANPIQPRSWGIVDPDTGQRY